MNYEKLDWPQYKIAQEIKNSGVQNPTLLCFYMLDYGFYTVTDILPVEKYFANNNFSEDAYPEMYNSFKNSIINQKTDFVLVYQENYDNHKTLFKNKYTQIYQIDTLLLFKKI